MDTSLTKEIIIRTTPSELRTLADKMEKQYKKSLAGDSIKVECIKCQDNILIYIGYDQEKM